MNTGFCPYCMNPVEPDTPCKVCGLTSGNYTPAPHHLPPGTVLKGRYLIGRVLGEGGFGITYIGCDLQLELKVAIKEYFPTDKANRISSSSLSVSNYSGSIGQRYEEGKFRFLQEARTMAKMDKQPVIVGVRDFFEANNTAYIVMEYVEGTTLKDLVSQRGGKIPVDELMRLMEPLFNALNYMHSLGLIHRDISPENLMLEQGTIRLLDFGCAREPADGNATLTIALKHGYAPIEQYQNKGQGPWTDVYALAATIYFCLTGIKPPQSMDRLCEDELILPRKLGIPLTENQEKALLCGMGIRPRKRFRSVEELRAAFYNEDTVFPDFVLETIPVSETDSFTLEKDNGLAPQPEITAPADFNNVEQEEIPIETKSRNKKLAIAAIIAGAAVLVFALVAVLIPKDAPVIPEEPPICAAEEILMPEELEYIEAHDVDELIFLMGNYSVEAISIPEGVMLNTSGKGLNDELILNKPLRIEKGGHLINYHDITVEEGGIIGVEGDFYHEGFLRMDGGKLAIYEGGHFINDIGFTWLRSNEDIYYSENAEFSIGDEYENYIVFNENEVFAEATHVSTYNEWISAIDSQLVKAIVVDGDITIKYDRDRYTEHSVMISESGSLTGFWSEEEGKDCTLCLGGASFVNYGNFTGNINPLHEEPSVIINYGKAVSDYYVDNHRSAFINLGEWYNYGGQVKEGSFVNVGYFNSGSEYEALSQGDSGGWVYFGNSLSINTGVMDFLGTDDYETYWDLGDNARFMTSGLVNIYGGAHLSNSAYMLIDGEFLFDLPDEVRGHFYNDGIIEVLPLGRFDAVRSDYNNEGSIVYYQDNSLVLPDGADLNRVLCLSEDAQANSADELKALMEDDSVSCIALNSPVTVEEEFFVTKGLICNAPLTIEGQTAANLFIEGEGAWLVAFNGLHIIGETHLRDGGQLVTFPGNAALLGDYLYVENSRAFLRGETTLLDGGRIELNNGKLRLLSHTELSGAEISVGNMSYFGSSSPLVLRSSNLTVDSTSEAHFNCLLDMDEASTLTNDGYIMFSSYNGYPHQLRGVITNNNWIEFFVPASITELINNGFVQTEQNLDIHRLENMGSFNALGGAQVDAKPKGNPVTESDELLNFWA